MALHYLAEAAFDDLLCTWRHHDDLRRRCDVAVVEMGRSRLQLEAARTRMRRLRRALYPTAEEQDQSLVTLLCETLDEVVELAWIHFDFDRPGHLTCPCGEAIEIPESARRSGSR